jgi:acyl-coenzyme A thioesterase PaaI-like protein
VTALPTSSTLAEEWDRALTTLVPRVPDLNIQTLELRRGYAKARATLAGNGNHYGSMYAGTLFGMAEMLGGALIWADFDFDEYLPTVKHMAIRYRRPAFTDVIAVASLDTSTVERMRHEATTQGKSEFEVDAVLTDTSGEVVVTTHGIYQIIARPRPGQ